MMARIPSVFETHPVSTLYALVSYASPVQLTVLYKQVNFILTSSEIELTANRRFAILRVKAYIFACHKHKAKKHRMNVAPPLRF